MKFSFEVEREENGQWVVEVAEVPGVMAVADTAELAKAEALRLLIRVVLDKLEHGEFELADALPGAIELPLVTA